MMMLYGGLLAALLTLLAVFSSLNQAPAQKTETLIESAAWTHLSTAAGDLPLPTQSTEQTAALILDINRDGRNDFVIGARKAPGPSLVWYRRDAGGWERLVIESAAVPIDAGGAFHDIDGDGDLDVVMGGDGSSNQIWWWENPYPNYSANTNWTRRLIKNSGADKHHDMIFGDFDGDGRAELVFWNQGANNLSLADIPADPRNTQSWPFTPIYGWSGGKSHEGLAKADVDGDGVLDIIGGGRWFRHTGGNSFQENLIDDEQRFTRAAAAQLVPGGRPEIVFVGGDESGPLKWYQWNGSNWVGQQLLDRIVDNGHSLEIGDVNRDGRLDIFVAEMRFEDGSPNNNHEAQMWVLLGDNQGNFTPHIVAEGYGNHESRLGDLDGDGDLDILGKPYTWDTPRLDIWLNNGNWPAMGRCATAPTPPPQGKWRRHVIDPNRPWLAVFVETADLDSDGDADIVAGAWWYENPGTPGGNWTRHEVGDPFNQHAIVHDFDGDGDPDLLGTVLDERNPNQGVRGDEFVWAQNDGTSAFTILDNPGIGDGDFLQGVAVWKTLNNQMQVGLSWHRPGTTLQIMSVPANPSSGIWPIQVLLPISQNEELNVADIDRDGDMDIMLGTKWLRNDGGTLTLLTLFPTADPPDRNELVDMNGDGRLDVVIGYEAVSSIGKVAWYEQPADPTGLWTEHLIAEIIGPMSLDVGDVDGDGDLDVVVGEHNARDPESARLFVYENVDGSGDAWEQQLVYEGDEHHNGAQLVDIDNDGDLDIVSVGWTHGRVVVYEQVSSGRLTAARERLAHNAFFSIIASCPS